ncbi:MAG: class I SAM-dependent methyltransferase [Candidatus Peribacteraceae bacterium]
MRRERMLGRVAFFFSKYRDSGALHWREMTSRSLRMFNAHQQARYDITLQALGNIRGKTVVDLGCGDGALTSLLVRGGGGVTGVDNETEGLELAKENFLSDGLAATFVQGSVEQCPLPDGMADAVVSCDVIEHLDHPDRHVAEISRVLKPGGVAVITTPYRICETPAPFHIHEFTPCELRSLAEPYFIDIRIRETHHMFWNAFFNYRPRLLRRIHLGRIFINMMTLWFRCNPFLEDATHRKKRDYFTQITLRGVKK